MRILSILFLSLQVTLTVIAAEEPKTFIVNHAWSEFINSSVHRIGYQFSTLPNPAVASVINGITIEWTAGDVIRSTTGAFMLEDGIWVQLDNDPTPTPLMSVFNIPDVTNVNPGGDTIQNQWVLKWDVATGRLVPATDLIGDASGGIYYFRDLYDTLITNPQSGEIPVYDATIGMWINATPIPVVVQSTPTPQPTATPMATPTPIGGWEFFATPTPMATATPAETPTPAATPTPFSVELAMPTPASTPTPMETPTPMSTPTPAATATPPGGFAEYATPTPMATATPAETPTPFIVDLVMPTPMSTPTPMNTPTPAATATPPGGFAEYATPTPLGLETPTPMNTPTPMSTPTPAATATPVGGFEVFSTPTPMATPTPNTIVVDQRLEASFPIYIASASCGVVAGHPTLDGMESILSVIDVQLGGINIPVEQCVPVSTVGSATRNDALRIYQRWCWFRATDKPAGMAHVVIGDVTP